MATPQIWFVTGSQHLYGDETLRQVASNSRELGAALSLPAEVVVKPVMTGASEIRALCQEANADPQCAGVILWMHTFSPAKMWIGGLKQLQKPMAHLHTQFNRDLPWESIDMDFMNLNQAAHGDREAGHLHARLGLARKVIVGHWSDARTQRELADWVRVSLAWHDWQGARIARFGDNMRHVAVTDGDKVSAEAQFGFTVEGYGVGDLVETIHMVSDRDVECLIEEYADAYLMADDLLPGGSRHEAVQVAARIEAGLRAFLISGGFKAFTTTFEDLHGLKQLPGLAVQRLMAEGFGFGAEGDWKTAALLRFAKVVGKDLPPGTSFMEDYTYHLHPARPRVLGAHMLEICPSIASGKQRLEVHPLGIGGKEDPARLAFDARPEPAVNASLIDLGDRFRLVVAEVDAVDVPEMPNLPVARALWECRPDFKTATTAWIYAGGAHHTVYSYSVTSEHFRMMAEISGIEVVVIDSNTDLNAFRNELRWNEVYYRNRG